MTAPYRSFSQGLIKNVTWNFAGQLWMLVLGFFATPFIVRSMNVSMYGIYTLVWVIIGYFSFLQFGLGTAATKYIAQYYVAREDEKIRKTFWVCLTVYTLMGIVGTGTIALFSRVIVERMLRIPPEFKETAVFVIRLGSLGLLITMVMSVISGTIQAVGRFDVLNLRGVVFGTLQIGLTVFLLKIGLSLKEVLISSLLIDLAGIYVLWIWLKKILPFLARPIWDKGSVFSLFRFGGFVSISGVVSPILANIEKLFLTSMRSVSTLTYYSVPFALMDKLTVIRSAFSSVLFPAFSSLQDSRDKKFNKDLFERSTLYIFLLYSFFVMFFIILGGRFLSAWIGNDFAEYSTRILSILAIAGVINAVASPAMNVLQGFNKPHIPALFHVIEAIVYIPTAYLLIRRFGGIGAAFAWFLRVFLDTILLHHASCHLFEESIFRLYARLIARSFIPVSVCGLALYGFKGFNLRFFSFMNISGLVVIFATYIFIVWKLGLDDFARQRMTEFVKGLQSR